MNWVSVDSTVSIDTRTDILTSKQSEAVYFVVIQFASDPNYLSLFMRSL